MKNKSQQLATEVAHLMRLQARAIIDSNRMKLEAAQQLGRLGGKSKSEAKKRAARENGKKGGAPKKGMK